MEELEGVCEERAQILRGSAERAVQSRRRELEEWSRSTGKTAQTRRRQAGRQAGRKEGRKEV